MLLINIAGLVLIGIIIWWFWLYHPKSVVAGSERLVVIVDDGVYTPANIKVPANQGIQLEFLRKDASPCAEIVQIPELEISEVLPLDKPKTINLPPLEKGEYNFHCQMQMYRGKLIVG